VAKEQTEHGYWPLSHIEQWIPILFGLAYIAVFLATVLA
jgi:hypothetical protein